MGKGNCALALRLIAFDRARNTFQWLTHRFAPYPWMTSFERYIVMGLLARQRPATCLEWGSGYSTKYFPRFSDGLTRWVAVEHDGKWYAMMRGLIKDPRVELVYVPPDREPLSGPGGEGSNEDLRRYVEYPKGLGTRFDLILVDGRARSACMEAAHGLLSDRGIVFLHDAQRDYYRAAVERYPYSYTFVDQRNGKTISLMGDMVDPRTLIDVAHIESIARCVMVVHNDIEGLVRDRLIRLLPTTKEIFNDC